MARDRHGWLPDVVTVTVNPAVDRVIEVSGLALGAHVTGKELSRTPAGKGINVTRALAKLGRASVATGFVGRPEVAMFDRMLKRLGPGSAIGQLLPVVGQTRVNTTLADREQDIDLHVRLAGLEVAGRDVGRLLRKLDLLSCCIDYLVISGSLASNMKPKHLRWMAEVGATRGARVAVDTHGGPLGELAGMLRESSVSAEGEPVLWLAAPNEAELAEATGIDEAELHDDDRLREAARKLCDVARWVLVTRGERGAMLVAQDACWKGELSLDEGSLVHTVGCGDCFLAGVIDAAMGGGEAEAMLRAGLAMGAAKAMVAAIEDIEIEQLDELGQRASISSLE